MRQSSAVKMQKSTLLNILVNIFKNAIEAMLETEPDERRLLIRIYAFSKGLIHVDISDTGHGITAENLERVFTHGFTTKVEGHGFGLHSCANAIRAAGGNLEVSSEGFRQRC